MYQKIYGLRLLLLLHGWVFMVETAVRLDDILRILGWSKSKFYRRRIELINAGVIFYRYEGRPPKKRLYAFPGRVQNWIALKASKREII